MSKTKKGPENTGKAVTKYDLKMERRRKEREKRRESQKADEDRQYCGIGMYRSADRRKYRYEYI